MSNPEAFSIDPDEPVYIIGVVSQLVGLPVWTLRLLDREGVVVAGRSEGRTRLYSLNDLKRLARVRQLMLEERVNIQGVKMIIRLQWVEESE